jgi:hypothetical protein
VSVGAALTFGVTTLTAASAPSFAQHADYETGYGPVSIAT